MVDQFGSRVRAVFVDQRKRRRSGKIVLHTQRTEQCHDKRCLSGSHLSIESKDGVGVHYFQELLCSLRQSLHRGNLNFMCSHF